MKPNQYTCPNCGANLAIDVEHLDKPMNCPFCDSPITALTDVLNTVIAEKEETKRTAMKEETKRTEIRENAITQRKENRWKNVNTTMKTTGDTISSMSNLVRNIRLLISLIVTAAVLIGVFVFVSKVMNTVQTAERGAEAFADALYQGDNNSGSAKLTAVNVTGKTLSDAKAELKSIGFTNLQISPETIPDENEWYVIGQGIKEGTSTDADAAFSLDCVSRDVYLTLLFKGHSVNEIHAYCQKNNAPDRYFNRAGVDITDKVLALDTAERENWSAVSAELKDTYVKICVENSGTASSGKTAEAPVTEAPKQETQPKTDSGTKTDGVSPAFKKQMDAYEAFFDEYIAMLQGVADGSFEAILNYASMMGKYEALLSEMEEIEEEDLSAADAQYYLEVYTRIMNKLMNVLN